MQGVAVKVPVSELGRNADQRALAELPVELFLQTVWIEFGEHGIERHPHTFQHCELMMLQVFEGVFECLDGAEIGCIALDRSLCSASSSFAENFKGLLSRRPEMRQAQPKLFLDLLASVQDI